MGRNDAKTQRWLPNAFALRSSDWRLCGMPGRGRPPGTRTAVRCDACRRNKFSAAHCQRQGHLAAAAGAANAAAAQPVPPGARCAHTSHGAAPGPQQPANNPTLLPLPVSPGHVARTPRSAGQQPSEADADASTGGQNLAGDAPGLQQPPNNPTLLPLPVTPVAARTGPVSCGARAPCRGGQQPRAAGEGFSGQNLFSSQAASGTPAAGAAASSARAPHGRLEADIGGDATRQRKREAAGARRKGSSLQEVAMGILRISGRMGLNTDGVQLTSWEKTAVWLQEQSVLADLFGPLQIEFSLERMETRASMDSGQLAAATAEELQGWATKCVLVRGMQSMHADATFRESVYSLSSKCLACDLQHPSP